MLNTLVSSDSGSDLILQWLKIENGIRSVLKRFQPHPFSGGLSKDNAETLFANYLAMSQAFPYIQAGAYRDLTFRYIHENRDIPKDVEVTFAVGSFLSWDETGGNYIVTTSGMKNLPDILDTENNYHSQHLKQDMRRLFGKEVKPLFSEKTKSYLMQLANGLGDADPVLRSAYMVAFEKHAEEMITALWCEVTRVFAVPKSELKYFQTHVGGDDPAEAYHVRMTQRMLENILAPSEIQVFCGEFAKAYELNYNWCRSLIHDGNQF